MPIMGPSTSVYPPPVQAHRCIRAMTFCPVENIFTLPVDIYCIYGDNERMLNQTEKYKMSTTNTSYEVKAIAFWNWLTPAAQKANVGRVFHSDDHTVVYDINGTPTITLK